MKIVHILVCSIFFTFNTFAQSGSTKKKTTSKLIENESKEIYQFQTDEEYIAQAQSDISKSFTSGELRKFIDENQIKDGSLKFKITLGAKNRIIAIFVEENNGVLPSNSNKFKDYLQFNAKFNFKLPKGKMIAFYQIFNFKS